MKGELLAQLKQWRDEQARVEGVETYRVMNNATLEALVGRMPTTPAELLEVKGIKEAKSRKYGKTLLSLLASAQSQSEDEMTAGEKGEVPSNEPLSVGQFLDGVNVELSGLAARVRGEVTSMDARERVVYFTLKDPEGEGMVNCVIFRYQYQVSGIELAIGDEVIVEGVPEIYKPSGRFSLKVGVIELAGEGALKKAYDALKEKLEKEGLFAPERKRSLPMLVERVALITSSDGAAIGDFTMNLGRNGIKVDFYPTAVEGKKAVFEIIQALNYFQKSKREYDCLVLIRGGGSMESLQAFNNEALIREVAALRIPVLCGVGHEKDITLAALVADVMVSTPTATARILAEPWEEARVQLGHMRTALRELYEMALREKREVLRNGAVSLENSLRTLLLSVRDIEQNFRDKMNILPHLLVRLEEHLDERQKSLGQIFMKTLEDYQSRLKQIEQSFRQFDPERLLSLGYSLVRSGESVIRSARELEVGASLDIQFKDGRVQSKVTKIL